MGKIISFTTEDLKKDLLTITDVSIKYASFAQKNIDSSEELTYKVYLPFIALLDICEGAFNEGLLTEAVGRYVVANQVILNDNNCLKNIKNALKSVLDSIDSMELLKVEKENLS